MQDKKDTLSLSSINLNQDQDNKQSPGKRVRDKFKMFESNYEIKFNNKEIKYVVFLFLN
jgi:transcriptional regulatory protein LevR